jgi:hypothetical protein
MFPNEKTRSYYAAESTTSLKNVNAILFTTGNGLPLPKGEGWGEGKEALANPSSAHTRTSLIPSTLYTRPSPPTLDFRLQTLDFNLPQR